MSFVLDNSVALAWCFKDEQTPAVMDLLDRVTQTGARAPLLWPLEAMNGLLAAERRKRINTSTRMRLIALLRDLPVFLDPDTADQSWDATTRLAERLNLTVYDATYLELAQRHQLPIATLDKSLQAAAIAIGLPPLDPSGSLTHSSPGRNS